MNLSSGLSKEKIVLYIIPALWMLLAFTYMSRTLNDHRSHDFDMQVAYTEYIVASNKFPPVDFSYITYHPPLYYFINSTIMKSLNSDRALHIYVVRLMSILYGAITLSVIAYLLLQATKSFAAQIITLFFVGTTPKFVFLFSTYNNDSLATMLCISIIALSYNLYRKWSNMKVLFLLILCTLAVYAKYTSIWCFGVISLICLKEILFLKVPPKNNFKLIGIFIFSVILFLPWAIFHNYHYSHKLFPFSFESLLSRDLTILQHLKNASTLLNIDRYDVWKDPWAHPGWDILPPNTKKVNYFSFVFLTSTIGEYIFLAPHAVVIFGLLFIRFLIGLLTYLEFFKSEINRLAISVIFLTYLTHIYFASKSIIPVIGCYMDFRLIAWTFAPWAILYSSVLTNKSKLIKAIFIIGIIFQIYILMTVEGTNC